MAHPKGMTGIVIRPEDIAGVRVLIVTDFGPAGIITSPAILATLTLATVAALQLKSAFVADWFARTSAAAGQDEQGSVADMTDAENLAKFLALVREKVATASTVDLATTDRNFYGFWLSEVILADGAMMSATSPDAFEELSDEADDLLGALDWNGVVGESAQGYATLDVPT